MMADFYSGYNDAGARNERSTLAQLQALSGAQNLIGSMSEQEAKEKARKRGEDFRSTLAALGPNATSEQVIQASRPFLEPDKAATLAQGAETSRLTRDNTKQIALARIAQQNDKLDNDYNIAVAKITDANERRAADDFYKRAKLALQTEAVNAGGDKLFYETGIRRPSMAMPAVPDAAPTSAMAPAGGTLNLQAPDEASAIAALKAGGFGTRKPTAMNIEIPSAPNAAPQAQSSVATPPAGAPQTAPAVAAAPISPVPLTRAQGGLAPDAPMDLRAQGQAAFDAAKAAPKPVTIDDAPAGLSPKKKQEWVLQQTKPSISGGGKLTPQALEFTAKQYLSGDRQAVQGFARSTTERVALQNAIVDEAVRRGMSPEAVAAQIADFAGIVAGSRVVGQRAANINLAATEAEEMIPIVKETSDKFARTNFVPWNMALKAYDTQTGSPEITNFGAALNTFVNVYARAVNPTGVPHQADKEHARQVLNSVQSPQQVDGVLGILKREMEIARRAPSVVREATRKSITGLGEGTSRADQFFR